MNRRRYLVLLLATVLLGLASRKYSAAFPEFIARYGGDTCWAMMIVWLLALIWPRMPVIPRASAAFAVCLAVETSQLYHTAWLDALRATTAGALVLGQGFLWSDVLCYSVGVVAAAAIDRAVVSRD